MNWYQLVNGLGGPVLAAIFGVAGVVLGRYIARGMKKDGEDRLNTRVNIALTALFSLIIIGYVRDAPDTSPLRVLGYGSAAGFIGLPLLELVAETFQGRIRGALSGFLNPPKSPKEPPDEPRE